MAVKHFKTISEFHKFRGLPKPEHPLISIFNVEDVKHLNAEEPKSMVFQFYGIALKRVANLKAKYGQQDFDFDDGIMSFSAPNQVFSLSVTPGEEIKQSGWVIYIHPDFFWNTPLAKTITQYDFWDYSLHEALHLSEKEEAIINGIIHNILNEYHANIDKFSKSIIVSHIESLLNYANRYYHRQFITREKTSHQILQQVEELLTGYFNNENLISEGLPTVTYLAQQLNLSPKYLSSLLKVLTGQSAQQHIHEKLIGKAKEKLSTTNLSISEIAYELGFEHLPSFSKLFKAKTRQSPMEFRASFN
jgi:AraC family transcriptional activator of pobA